MGYTINQSNYKKPKVDPWLRHATPSRGGTKGAWPSGQAKCSCLINADVAAADMSEFEVNAVTKNYFEQIHYIFLHKTYIYSSSQ